MVGTSPPPTYHPVITQLTRCRPCHTSRSRQRRTATAASGSATRASSGGADGATTSAAETVTRPDRALVAGVTGVGAWWLGQPFLTSAHVEWTLPLIGRLPLTSTAVFDLGVYLVVVGATMLMLVSLAEALPEEEG